MVPNFLGHHVYNELATYSLNTKIEVREYYYESINIWTTTMMILILILITGGNPEGVNCQCYNTQDLVKRCPHIV